MSPVASHCRFFLYFLSNQVNWCCPSTRPSLISARRAAANSTSRRALAVATAISCISNACRASCCGVCARQSATNAAAAARDPDAARAVATAAAATIITMAAAGRIAAEAAAAAMGANTSVVDRRRRAAIASAAIAIVMNPLPPLHRRPPPPPPRRDPSGRTAKSGAKRLPSGMPSARSVRRRARAQSNRSCERRVRVSGSGWCADICLCFFVSLIKMGISIQETFRHSPDMQYVGKSTPKGSSKTNLHKYKSRAAPPRHLLVGRRRVVAKRVLTLPPPRVRAHLVDRRGRAPLEFGVRLGRVGVARANVARTTRDNPAAGARR